MPLDFKTIKTPLAFGLAEGVDPRQAPFGTLVQAENVCWKKSGRIGKRRGLTALSTSIVGGGSLSAAARLITRNGTELGLIDGANLYSYSSSGWMLKGRLPEVGLDWLVSFESSQGVQVADSCTMADGTIVEAWITGDPSQPGLGALYYQIRDLTTGSVKTPPTLVTSASPFDTRPTMRLVSNGSTWVLLFVENLSGYKLRCVVGSGGSVATSTLQTNAATTAFCALDACQIGTNFVIAYTSSGGNIQMQSYSFASPPVLANSSSITTTGVGETVKSISVCGAAGENVYVTYWDSAPLSIIPSFYFSVRNATTLASVVGPTLIEADSGGAGGTVASARLTSTSAFLIYYFSDPSSVTQGLTQSVTITNAGVMTFSQVTPFLRPLSRPILIGSRFYMAFSAAAGNNTQTSRDSFMADVTPDNQNDVFREVGKVDVNIGGRFADGYVSSPSVQSGTVTFFCLPFAAEPAATAVGTIQGVRAVRALTGASLPLDMWRGVEVGPETGIVGGVYGSYDGVQVIGWGWPTGPIIDVLTPSGAGGHIVAGNYIYSLVAERITAVGTKHRSPVATPKLVTVPGTNLGSVAIVGKYPQFGHGVVAGQMGQFVFFRTIINGSVPQRIGVEPVFDIIADAIFNPIYGSPFIVTDTYADASIANGQTLATRDALYTASGELEDTQPPSFLTQCLFQQRICGISGDGRTLWISKALDQNPGIAPGFHPNLTFPLDRVGVAVCSMDDRLVLFFADRIRILSGSGPALDGSGASYAFSEMQSDVGCINPRSVVQTQDGVMFLSVRGLYLLGRDLSVGWIGRSVQDQLAAYPNVTSAVLVPAKNEVRFTCNNAGGTNGIVLVYNYIEKQWSVSKYTVGGVYGCPIADAILYQGVWTFVTPAGVVMQENDANCLDAGVWVPMTIQTTQQYATGPLDYMSVRNFALEGTSVSNHQITIGVSFNGGAVSQTKTFADNGPVTAIGPLETLEISIGPKRKCQMIQFTISDAAPAGSPVGTGDGFVLDMIGIEVGVKKGFMIKPAVNTG